MACLAAVYPRPCVTVALIAISGRSRFVRAPPPPRHRVAPTLYGWRFLLEAPEPRIHLEAEEEEDTPSQERAELMAVVRGLEAIDQPSNVTLYTASRFVIAGLRYGISEWRQTQWHWEWYGKWAPVAHQDLWRRVETALRFHDVEPRWWARPELRSEVRTGARRVIRLDDRSPLDPPHMGRWDESSSSYDARTEAGRSSYRHDAVATRRERRTDRMNARSAALLDREAQFPYSHSLDF
jgi:ribonuclease HI